MQVFDADLSALGNYQGANLSLARRGDANAEDQFSATGGIRFSGSDLKIIASNTTIGTVNNTGGTLSITFNSNANQASVNATLAGIAYRNTDSTPPASVKLDWTFNDGNTGSQGSPIRTLYKMTALRQQAEDCWQTTQTAAF